VKRIAVDALWANEAESRFAAYRAGQIKAIPLAEVLSKYKQRLRPGQPTATPSWAAALARKSWLS
jgi:hypothetical protein